MKPQSAATEQGWWAIQSHLHLSPSASWGLRREDSTAWPQKSQALSQPRAAQEPSQTAVVTYLSSGKKRTWNSKREQSLEPPVRAAVAVGLLSAPASTAMAPVGTWSRALYPQCGTLVVDRLCNCTTVTFALESRVSKNTSGITPYHSPSGATVLSVHIEMGKACCFCKCGVWPIASELLAADPVVLARASVPDFSFITGLEMLWAWVCATWRQRREGTTWKPAERPKNCWWRFVETIAAVMRRKKHFNLAWTTSCYRNHRFTLNQDQRTATREKEYKFILKNNNLAWTQTGVRSVDWSRKNNIYPQNLDQFFSLVDDTFSALPNPQLCFRYFHLHKKVSWLLGLLVRTQRRNGVCCTWNAVPTSRASMIQKARRATPASKPMCNIQREQLALLPGSLPTYAPFPASWPSAPTHAWIHPPAHRCCTQRCRHRPLQYSSLPFSSHPYLQIFHLSLCLHATHFLAQQQFISQWWDMPWNIVATTAISSHLWSGLSYNCHFDTQGWPPSFCTRPQICREQIQYQPDTAREEPVCPGRSTHTGRGRRQPGEGRVPHRDEGCTPASTLSCWERALVCPGAELRCAGLLFYSCKGRWQDIYLLTETSHLRSGLRHPVMLSSPKLYLGKGQISSILFWKPLWWHWPAMKAQARVYFTLCFVNNTDSLACKYLFNEFNVYGIFWGEFAP